MLNEQACHLNLQDGFQVNVAPVKNLVTGQHKGACVVAAASCSFGVPIGSAAAAAATGAASPLATRQKAATCLKAASWAPPDSLLLLLATNSVGCSTAVRQPGCSQITICCQRLCLLRRLL